MFFTSSIRRHRLTVSRRYIFRFTMYWAERKSVAGGSVCLTLGQSSAQRPSVSTTCCLLTVSMPGARGYWPAHLLCADHLYRSTSQLPHALDTADRPWLAHSCYSYTIQSHLYCCHQPLQRRCDSLLSLSDKLQRNEQTLKRLLYFTFLFIPKSTSIPYTAGTRLQNDNKETKMKNKTEQYSDP